MKITFIHAGLRNYRNYLFNRLSKEFDIEFLIYGGKVVYESKDEWLDERKNWKFEILNSFPFFAVWHDS